MLQILKTIGAFLFAATLIYIGFEYLLTGEQKSLFFSTSIRTHLISIVLLLPVYISGGIGLRLLYGKISKVTISIYDTITLPIVMNLWGFIIPFQGSLIYTSSYIYSKYRKSISESVRVSLVSFSISMCLAGFVGIIFFFTTKIYVPGFFLLISLLLFINPGIFYSVSKFARHFKSPDLAGMRKILEWSRGIFSLEQIDGKLIFYLLLVNILNVASTTLWSYWIVLGLNLNLTIIQLILIALLMKFMLLVKLTPGNLGLNQLASGGIALLVGGKVSDGFLLSAFQYLSLILVAFTVGIACTIVNMKHFKWQRNDSAA